MQHNNYPLFVQAARVAAHLHFAAKTAKSLSLTAKNARAISIRAGQKAIGFRAITDFIEDLANTTMAHANTVNAIAIETSHMAAIQSRQKSALNKFNHVIDQSAEHTFIASIMPLKAQTEKLVTEHKKKFDDNIFRLKSQLSETQNQIRSANIISSTSKVEAIGAGEFRGQLENIADNIERAADEIKTELSHADTLLRQVARDEQ